METNGTGAKRTKWLALKGHWNVEGSTVRYLGEPGQADERGRSGVALVNEEFREGRVSAKVRFDSLDGWSVYGGLVLGFQSSKETYVGVTLGGVSTAYSIGEWPDGLGPGVTEAAGIRQNLAANQDYHVEAEVHGQKVRMRVDGVKVLETTLPSPLRGAQVGLRAKTNRTVTFSDFKVDARKPLLFVAMQFSEPFDSIFKSVIEPSASRQEFEVVRIDQVAGPGIIFQDIQQQITESTAVIAEITPENPNVFYELGFAHALKKPTILLANRGTALPFDVRSYRVVFYDNTIGGKERIEESLEQHLKAIRRD